MSEDSFEEQIEALDGAMIELAQEAEGLAGDIERDLDDALGEADSAASSAESAASSIRDAANNVEGITESVHELLKNVREFVKGVKDLVEKNNAKSPEQQLVEFCKAHTAEIEEFLTLCKNL